MESKMETDGDREREGNTEPLSSRNKTKSTRPTQRKYYCFTQYEFVETELLIKKWLSDNCEKCLVGYEICPTTGRPHLQGFFALKKKMRITEIQNKPITWSKLIPCNGSEEQNITYCSKDKNIWFQYPTPRRPLNIISELRPFQSQIESMINEEPNDREIIWIYDLIGKKGKSAFCRYLIHKYNACYLTEGKKSDLINIVYNYVINQELNLVLVDVPRDNKNISYKTLEEIKNGIICNTKYETGTMLINPPHIVVFANFYPDTTKFSEDRWSIFEINEEFELTKPLTI